jgi:hypothetical protein
MTKYTSTPLLYARLEPSVSAEPMMMADNGFGDYLIPLTLPPKGSARDNVIETNAYCNPVCDITSKRLSSDGRDGQV